MFAFNSCNDEPIQKEYEYLAALDLKSLDETIDEKDRYRAWMMADMRRQGSLCPVPPKIKVQAVTYLFGALALILICYNIFRNVCSVRIE